VLDRFVKIETFFQLQVIFTKEIIFISEAAKKIWLKKYPIILYFLLASIQTFV
jgi:hypothetical protein